MKFKNVLILIFLLFIGTLANAQMKMGYVNIDLVLAYMPEVKTMNQQLQTFQQKLGEKIQVKEQYAQSKLMEYQEFIQENEPPNEDMKKAKEEELMKLDEEIKKEAREAEQKMLDKRQELLAPILEKMDANLKSLAIEQGYDYIINSVDGNGTSIVLHGPEEHNLTEKLMKKLGIEIPSNN